MTELTSWKEIAAYLGVSVRTAQMWEAQRGLPIHRLPGPRGRVMAKAEDLDRWKLSGAGPETSARDEAVPQERRTWNRTWVAAGALAAILAGSIAIGRQGKATDSLRAFDPSPLTSGHGQEMKPSLSPDGLEVAFLERKQGSAAFQAVVMNLATGAKRIITEDLAQENAVHWSPDGEWLAVSRFHGGKARIGVVPAKGGTIQDAIELKGEDRLFNSMEALRANWMARETEICYSDREAPAEGFGLFVTNIRTGKRRRLTSPPAGFSGDVQCTPSPDGKSIAFVRQRTISEGDTYVLDLENGQQRQLTRWNGHFVGLAWLPGSKGLLAGCGVGTAGSSIWHLSTEGFEPKRLTGREAVASMPSVVPSRGGIRVVYQVLARDVNVWRWSEAEGARQMTDSILTDQYPAVNAAGELAWISRRTGAPEVWISGRNGENPQRVTYLDGPYADFPRWSPDGRFLAFASILNSSRDVFILERQTRALHTIAGTNSEEGRASFSQDGRYLYFRSDRSGTREIWKGAISEHPEPQKLTDGGGYEGFEDPAGRWLYYIKERERPGLWRTQTRGGKAEFVAADVWEGRWAVAADGVYAMQLVGGKPGVNRLDWNGKNVGRVMEMPAGKTIEAGLAVSRDGKSIYWAQVDRMDADLMTVLLR